jgi:hypothetical protein
MGEEGGHTRQHTPSAVRSFPPVYATIPPPHRHQSEGERPRLNLRILHMTPVGEGLTINRASSEPCEVEDCVFLRRIHQERKGADDADDELWEWVYGETELYWTMGRGDDGDDESDEDGEDHKVDAIGSSVSPTLLSIAANYHTY